MGNTLSVQRHKISLEQKLTDHKRQLTRVLSKSNSMESLDKAEVQEIKTSIRVVESELDLVKRVVNSEEEDVPSF
jgi:hypothetical protein